MKSRMKQFYIIIRIMLIFVAGCTVVTVFGTETPSAHAYTEAQKKQAKSWLSAHGYPPTKAGAYQAYHDYRSGKLTLNEKDQKRVDESLGKITGSDNKKKEKDRNKKKKKKKKQKKQVITAAPERKITPEPTVTPTAAGVSAATAKPAHKNASDSSLQKMNQKREPEAGKGDYVSIGVAAIILLWVWLFLFKRKKRMTGNNDSK